MQETTRFFPFLRYEDAPAAFEWLHRAFGFEKQMLVPGPRGTIAHAQLRYGASVLMIGTAEDDFMNMKSPKAAGGVTQGIYVHVDDIEAHHDRARAAGAEIIMALEDTEYGSREYAARDIEGQSVEFRDLRARDRRFRGRRAGGCRGRVVRRGRSGPLTPLRNTACAFIGAGAMGEAMIGGLLRHNLVAPDAVTASDTDESRLRAVERRFEVRTSP